MDPTLSEWLNLAFRWVHVMAAILWVGQTYFFSWLDGRLEARAHGEGAGAARTAWMVHSGGFYRVEKHAAEAGKLPRPLYWFRWEAAVTWVSGFVLLWIVYYLGGVLRDPDSPVGEETAIAIGLGSLVGGWVVYDVLWRSPLGRWPWVGGAVSFGLVMALVWGLDRALSARAAYMHVGAVLGTIMAANVWLRILPAQRRMVASIERGEAPDARLGESAKARSRHNTYMTVPLVFIMLSSHFFGTYGHAWNWLILGVLVLLGWVARRLMLLHESR